MMLKFKTRLLAALSSIVCHWLYISLYHTMFSFLPGTKYGACARPPLNKCTAKADLCYDDSYCLGDEKCCIDTDCGKKCLLPEVLQLVKNCKQMQVQKLCRWRCKDSQDRLISLDSVPFRGCYSPIRFVITSLFFPEIRPSFNG